MLRVSATRPPFEAPEIITDAELTFERFKAMEGTWTGAAADGQRITNTYEVIAGGSVVLQSSNFDAHPGEKMVTMFRLDLGRLILTHYCVAKNQPRLAATAYSEGGRKVTFTFESATNLKDRSVGHMDKAVYEFTGGDTYKARWTWYQDGKESWMESFTLRRQKG
ncbi:MAG: hypothetical protein IH945_13565 [Armatimonadetes bacterium]|nr:hypothetical protein [Armatimonadota bacterium]